MSRRTIPGVQSFRRPPVQVIRAALARAGSIGVGSELRAVGVALGPGCRFLGRPLVSMASESSMVLGARLVAISSSAHTALGVNHPVILRTLRSGATIEIGADVGLSGATICAASRISIGDGSLLGSGVTVVDTNFHPVSSPQRRYAALPEPKAEDEVVIGRNVFLGAGVIVLPGSSIGDDAVIGAGAVVRGPISPGAVVVGNPAATLRSPHLLDVDDRKDMPV